MGGKIDFAWSAWPDANQPRWVVSVYDESMDCVAHSSDQGFPVDTKRYRHTPRDEVRLERALKRAFPECSTEYERIHGVSR